MPDKTQNTDPDTLAIVRRIKRKAEIISIISLDTRQQLGLRADVEEIRLLAAMLETRMGGEQA